MWQKVLETKAIMAGFTDRWDGVSKPPYDTLNLALYVGDNKKDVLENRQLLAKKLKIKQDNFAWMNQIHSDDKMACYDSNFFLRIILQGDRIFDEYKKWTLEKINRNYNDKISLDFAKKKIGKRPNIIKTFITNSED